LIKILLLKEEEMRAKKMAWLCNEASQSSLFPREPPELPGSYEYTSPAEFASTIDYEMYGEAEPTSTHLMEETSDPEVVLPLPRHF
jgi:hypothetical protein